jgi:hypothetical protein
MKPALRILAQAIAYLPLLALIGYFSSYPRYRPIPEGEALVRVSFVHAAQRKHACRQRTAEELAKLAPNMRAAEDCPRERADVTVEIDFDGQPVLRRTVAPSGLKRDGNAAVYHRFTVPAGSHRVAARLRDRAQDGFNHVREATLELKPGAAIVIDFSAEQGGFLFRG